MEILKLGVIEESHSDLYSPTGLQDFSLVCIVQRKKTVFCTPYNLHQFVTLPPATFQYLTERVLRPHAAYADTYLDNVINHSDTWAEHVQRVAVVLESLRRTGLKANPK